MNKLFLVILINFSCIAMENDFHEFTLYKLPDQETLYTYLSQQFVDDDNAISFQLAYRLANYFAHKQLSAFKLAHYMLRIMADEGLNLEYTGTYTKDHKKAANLIKVILSDNGNAIKELKDAKMLQEGIVNQTPVDVFFYTISGPVEDEDNYPYSD